MNENKYNPVPEPPINTTLNSSLNGEQPRTLWMGDLDPLFNENTLKQIWLEKGFKVKIKLIKNKKNLLIPCSNKFQKDNFGHEGNKRDTANVSTSKNEVIEINGMKFVDPTTTNLHHSGYCFVEFESFELASKGLHYNTLPIPNFNFQPELDDLVKLEMINQKNAGLDAKVTFFFTNKNNDRCFRLNWASSTTLSSPSVQTPEYSMFIGDLKAETTEIQVMVFFQKFYKSVKTVRIMTDPVSGKSRCFGFVRFGDKDEREDCVKMMNGKELNGNPIKCALAAPRTGSKQNMIDTTDFRNKSKGHARSKSYDYGNTGFSNSFGHRKSHSGSSNYYMKPPDEKNCIFVKGLNRNLDEGELFTCFQKIGKILKIKTYSDRGCAFIDFDTKIDALKAISELDGYILGSTNAPIKVTWSRDSNQGGFAPEEKLSSKDIIPTKKNENMLTDMDTFSIEPKSSVNTFSYQSSNDQHQFGQNASSNFSQNLNYQYPVSAQQLNGNQSIHPMFSSNLMSSYSKPIEETQNRFSQDFSLKSENTNNYTTTTGMNTQTFYNSMNPLVQQPNFNPNNSGRSSLLASSYNNDSSNKLLNSNPTLMEYLRNKPNSYTQENTDKSIWDN